MPQIFVDGHVHIHPSFSLKDLFGSAYRNVCAHHPDTQPAPDCLFLLLTESAGAHVFATLQKELAADQLGLDGFVLEATAEAYTLVCRDGSGIPLYLVAGRQIVTAERLEVLALGYKDPFPDGQPINEVLQELAAQGCVLVLPWGAGKWLGKRGKKVEELIGQAQAGQFFLGDNANRPFFWPLPDLFARAQARGILNLAGSDPLPFPGQERKAGSFGVQLTGALDPAHPFAALRDLLLNPATALTPFGRCEQLYPFFKHQISMQLHKKSSSSPASCS